MTSLVTDIILNYKGLSEHSFNKYGMYCVFNKEKKAYTYFICISCGLLPSICCAYCYGKIFDKTYVAEKRLSKNITESKVKKLALTLFYSYALYALCWIPISLNYIINYKGNYALIFEVICSVFAYSHGAINPIFYFSHNNSTLHLVQRCDSKDYTRFELKLLVEFS